MEKNFINLNKMLAQQSSRKLLSHFTRLLSVKAYIIQNPECIITKRGRVDGGTWADAGLAELFERWLDRKPISKYLRLETEFEDFLFKVFGEVCVIERQYKVGKYFIDWYIPAVTLAIEYDEKHHAYQGGLDSVREKGIKKVLKCDFVRVKMGEEKQALGLILKHVLKKYIKILT